MGSNRATTPATGSSGCSTGPFQWGSRNSRTCKPRQHLADVRPLVGRRQRPAHDLVLIERLPIREEESDRADEAARQDQVVVAGHLADDDEDRERRFGGGGEEAGHADQGEGGRRWGGLRKAEVGQHDLHDQAQRGAAAATDDDGRAEHAAGAAAADRQAGRHDLAERHGGQDGGGRQRLVVHVLQQVAVQRRLQRPVAERQDGQDVFSVPSQKHSDHQADGPGQAGADRRLQPARQRDAVEQMGEAVEAAACRWPPARSWHTASSR